ncbi:non-ribosomal peptide synthetase [Gorillibacterium massiliense]|uniref:non-ribosomal peptide synthetase n=1 Tax=Gorillibacterium massiliense TaxID=1280390 RepID=UPI0004B99F5E|nr:non-ribosomal peptide synthetase [Gorillibacterium massiliense]
MFIYHGEETTLEEEIKKKVLYGAVEKYPDRETIPSMLGKVVNEHSGKIAISFGSSEMTYGEFYRKSAKIAHSLISAGMRKGDFVGIYMNRSPETIISILGVLRAGGVYIPIDPEHPLDRNLHIVKDSSCKFFLLKEANKESAANLLAGDSGVVRLSVEDAFLNAPETFQDIPVSPDDLAYAIYTSGSTGRPKGTLLAHRGVINLCNTIGNALHLTADDIVSQFSTFSFDASVFDTFNALLRGAHLAMLTKEEQTSPALLVDLVARRKITFLICLPTSVFNRMAEHVPAEESRKLATVKVVLVAGEALLSESVRKFQTKFGSDRVIVNAYGPTECTVAATMYKITGFWSRDSVTVPIGHPIGNYNIYVMKDDGALASIGEEGELCIETIGIAKGYLNLPEKTADVFVKNPYGPGLIYRSGDIVKVLPEDGLEFLFRKDGQLKLHGFRIEIGEIENALSKHPSILDAAVVAIKKNGAVSHLSCFFTEKTQVTVKDLKEHLGQHIPYYMVPSYFYRLKTIPLSPTGKIDRNTLGTMDNPQAAELDEPFEAPVGELETMLASVWSNVLEMSPISRNASFFDIGGDSLSVMVVLSHLKLDYYNLRMGDLYEHKTVKALAAHISTLDKGAIEEAESISERIDLTELPALPKNAMPDRDGLGSDVLLTGATGYLGAHLAYELLTATDAVVRLLVRPKPGVKALSRIRETLDGYFGPHFSSMYLHRISVLEGDFVEPRLGLDDEDYGELIQSVQSIIHAGADVRHFGDSETFQTTNVQGTENLLALVKTNRNIAFHYVSTLGIPEDMAFAGCWNRSGSDVHTFYNTALDNVYTNSKLAGEKLVAQAAIEGYPCSIYRAGNLSCHSATGRFQKNINENYFYRMIKGFLLLGKAPMVDTFVDITPVDFASRFMVSLMKRSQFGEIYHICNPEQVHYSSLISVLRNMGYSLEMATLRDFNTWVLSRGNAVSKEGVQLVMAMLDGDGVRNSPFRFSCEASLDKTEMVDLEVPLESLVEKFVSHAVHVGYFPSCVTVGNSGRMQ